MRGSTVKLRGPSGDQVTIGLPDDAKASSVAAEVRFVGGGYSRGFQIGPRGYHDFACNNLLNATPRERFVVRGREVTVATTASGNTTFVTLLERYHEMMTVFSGPPPARDTLAEMFGALDIDDNPRGLRVRPATGLPVDVVGERFAVAVADRGKLSIPGPRHTKAIVPRHRGVSTESGEMWRLPLPGHAGSTDARDHLFIIGGPKGAAEVRFDQRDGLDEQALLSWAGGISVAWQAA